jgi:hypothetical protein
MMRHFHDGLTNAEIGEMYGTTPEAVRQRLAKMGIQRGTGRPSHAHYLPWTLRSDHSGHVLAKRLRAYSKQQQGKQLSDEDARLLAEWRRFMDGENSLGLALSVHYNRADDEGFWLDPRQPGDRDYISPPPV